MARKQEQESAREEVTEVGPGVLRMELPISMPGLGHVNCYALIDGDGAAVVDPGLPGPATWRAIKDRLRRADLAVKHVHTVIVTHSHPDHFGGAARFAKESGAKIVAHKSFRFGPMEPEVSVEDLEAERAAEASERGEREDREDNAPPPITPRQLMQRKGTPWGGEGPRPPFKTRIKWRAMRLLGRAPIFPVVTHPVKAGDRLTLAGREWQVVHTPGHTEDHVCLHDPEAKLFLAGDHVLPTITPHISGLTHYEDPLNAFFESLDLAASIPDVECALPAHGHPFADLAGRCEAIKQHHFERLEKVRSIGSDLGPSTVEAFSQRLFKPRSWGPMADSETYAHLEHLRIAGNAERSEDKEGRYIYAT